MKRILILIVSVIMVGCLSSYDKVHMEAAIRSVEARTAFDIDCEEVSSSLLGDINYILPSNATLATMNIGVNGCNKKAVYFAECVLKGSKSTCTPRLNTINTVTETKKSSEDNEAEKSN